jgi:hypothetical protein
VPHFFHFSFLNKFLLGYIYYTGVGFIVTIPIRLIVYISYFAPSSVPLNTLPCLSFQCRCMIFKIFWINTILHELYYWLKYQKLFYDLNHIIIKEIKCMPYTLAVFSLICKGRGTKQMSFSDFQTKSSFISLPQSQIHLKCH